MAQRSGLFDSTEIVSTEQGYPKGNRAETADFFARYFSNFIGNGIFAKPANCFAVEPAGGLDIVIRAGACFINGYAAFDDADETMTLTAGNTYYVVQRAHIIAGGDIQKVAVMNSSLDETPRRDGTYHDLLLAVVTVPSGVSEISYSMIADYRYDSDYCGLVHATVDQLDTSEVARQLRTATDEFIAAAETQLENNETEFDTWFETIIGKLGTDPAGQLELNKADKVVGATSGNFAALDASGNLVDSRKKIADFVAANPLIAQYVNGALQTLGGTAITLEGVKVETGTYTGNNSMTRSLTLGFAPKALFVAKQLQLYNDNRDGDAFMFLVNNAGFAIDLAVRSFGSYYGLYYPKFTAVTFVDNVVTWSGSSITLRMESSGVTDITSTNEARAILNQSAYTYYYIAIG